jgi:hypothetical protein
MKSQLLLALVIISCFGAFAQKREWYTQGDFHPVKRIAYTVVNELDIPRENCPVIITRNEFPLPDIHEMWITVVDPLLPPSPEPSDELLRNQGGHELRKEANGHAIFHQLDDMDKDGIWDELLFVTNLKPKERRTIYIYMGENIRGWNKHFTHANIGSYARHQMPFWESENVGWKIWFANSVDVFAKRKPMLMANRLYMENLDGYGVSNISKDLGSDIQSVAETFGGGAICLFEYPAKPDSASRPRFTPAQAALAPKKSMWNAGQISDTRYAYEVVTNGPLRSTIKIKTMNWDTGKGFYELEQYYSVYANQSYSTCKVNYNKFFPAAPGVLMGCGIRKKPGQEDLFQQGGIVISSGPEGVKDPEKIDDRAVYMMDFIGKAVVKGKGGNHALKITAPEGNSFEYAIFAAWKDGAVLNTPESFKTYVINSSQEFNSPVKCLNPVIENK